FPALTGSTENRKGEGEGICPRDAKTTISSQGRQKGKERVMRNASLVLALSAWAALTRPGRAEDVAKLPVPDGPPAPVAVNGHGGPAGCATCGHADLHGGESHNVCGDVRRPCLSRFLQWATYRPLPFSCCASSGSCGGCHSWRFWQGCGGCCKECLPC